MHYAPETIKHGSTEEFDPEVPTGETSVVPGKDGLKDPEKDEVVEEPTDEIVKHGPTAGSEVKTEPIAHETKRELD
ncbi:hypothetical protein BU107_14320, partial [Staphylococcus xylosus]